jgi:hypothetical protein
MKRSAIFFALMLVGLSATTTAFAQKGCEFNISGTWKAASAYDANPILYRFALDGTVTALAASGADPNAELRELATATYQLDNPRAPKTITFGASKEGAGFAAGITSMEITGYDDTSFTCVKPGAGPTRWIKVDPYRYFVVLAGRRGTFYDRSGAAFSMLIKTDREKTQVDAVGIYAAGETRIFGPIPAATYNQFMKEPRTDTDVMLRIEIAAAQYERSMKILATWERRVREDALLYPDVALDNILLVKQVTESLNQCGETLRLYNLDWGINDGISDNNRPPHIPFQYFKELRRLNDALHVRDEKFYERRQPGQQRAGQ